MSFFILIASYIADMLVSTGSWLLTSGHLAHLHLWQLPTGMTLHCWVHMHYGARGELWTGNTLMCAVQALVLDGLALTSRIHTDDALIHAVGPVVYINYLV